jgi:DNA-binding transcriptional ArsR family regulator
MSATAAAPADVECVADPPRAAALLHPLRLRILEQARRPASATDVAARLGEPRQKVNYHVHELARVGLLRPAGQRRKGNLIERRYVATARAYVLTSEPIAALAPMPRTAPSEPTASTDAAAREVADEESAVRLLAVTCRVQTEVGRALERARAEGKRLPTLSLTGEVRFTGARQRAEFARALRDAVADVVARWSAPARAAGGRPRRGRPYRLAVTCHPVEPGGDPAGHDRSEGGGEP